jgi:enoyl-CoA hydratase/carnithine racemase
MIPSSAPGPVSTPTLFASHGHTATFTLDRPDLGHAMTWAMYDALADACERVDAATQVRVFVIRATGDVFCTGTDISQFASFSTREDGIEYERRLEACLSRLERVSAVTIAQVEGIAAGAGCAIALACDLRVCGPTARFGVPIARTLGNGLSAENCARLVAHFGVARARRMLIAGEFIDVEEAAAAGVVARLARAGEAGGVVDELATSIAGHAPLTIRAAKAAFRHLTTRGIATSGIDSLVADCYASDDFRERVSAFLARRK